MVGARTMPDHHLTRRSKVVFATYLLAAIVAVAPLFVVVGLIDVAGAAFLAAGLLRLTVAVPESTGLSRLAGTTSVGLGVALLAASGEGVWSLPVLFTAYLVVEAGLRLAQALQRRHLRLYSAGLLAILVALGIQLGTFCGSYQLFGPLVGMDLAVSAWAFAAKS